LNMTAKALFLLLLGATAGVDGFLVRPGRSFVHRLNNNVEGMEISGGLEPLSNFVLVKVSVPFCCFF
jgi:hypothetical protein